GKRTVERNLKQALRAIANFHAHVMPVVCSLFAEPDLLAGYRESLNRHGKGPQRSMGRLRDYLRAEQELGRLRKDLNPGAAATILMSASFFRCFTEQFFEKAEPLEAFSSELIAVLVGAP